MGVRVVTGIGTKRMARPRPDFLWPAGAGIRHSADCGALLRSASFLLISLWLMLRRIVITVIVEADGAVLFRPTPVRRPDKALAPPSGELH